VPECDHTNAWVTHTPWATDNVPFCFLTDFSQTLQFTLQGLATVMECCLSVMRVYCDEIAEAGITYFSLKSSKYRSF